MAKIDTYQCDICQTQKKDVNHWWLGDVLNSNNDGTAGASIYLWEDAAAQDAHAHLCGIECAQRWLTSRLQELLNKLNNVPSSSNS